MSHRWMIVALLSASGALAELEPPHVIDRGADEKQRAAARPLSEAAQTLTRGDFNAAIETAKRALTTSSDPWAHYVQGAALIRLGKLDDGLTELRVAEQAFPREERWSRSVAIWGRANALHQAGRCDEAKSAYTDYIRYVGKDDPAAVDLAQKQIDGCKPAWVAPAPAK